MHSGSQLSGEAPVLKAKGPGRQNRKERSDLPAETSCSLCACVETQLLCCAGEKLLQPGCVFHVAGLARDKASKGAAWASRERKAAALAEALTIDQSPLELFEEEHRASNASVG